MLKEFKVAKGQTLLDVTIQHAGTLEALIDVARASGISMTEDVAADQTLQVDLSAVDNYVLTQIKSRNIILATGFGNWVESGGQPTVFGGIDYMGIEIDFLVS
ncbi:MAG: hypothetical protein HC896_12850 [Bacteroidales bacterium]|nr:hypothetical protein [Bacteroidales bacterium]